MWYDICIVKEGLVLLMEFEPKIPIDDNTRSQIIFQLLISLNQGNCASPDSGRVSIACNQYNALVENGIITGEKIVS